jgi:flagellar hook-basal body complex protein FliE
MIVPAVGGLASKLSEGLANGVSAQAGGGLAQGGRPNAGLEAAGGPGAAGGVNGVEGAGGLEGPAGGGSVSFGNELTSAISSLESTQKSADGAAQTLATGTAKDPESAVVTVEDAQMAMDLASTIRTKATETVQSILQTQV